jgi:phosphotransacetylase
MKKMRKIPIVALPGAGSSRRLVQLAADLLAGGAFLPLLLGRREDFLTTGEILGLDLRRARFLFPVDDPLTDEFAASPLMGETFPCLTIGHLRALLLSDEEIFSLVLVQLGHVDHAVLSPAGSPESRRCRDLWGVGRILVLDDTVGDVADALTGLAGGGVEPAREP